MKTMTIGDDHWGCLIWFKDVARKVLKKYIINIGFLVDIRAMVNEDSTIK